MAQNELYGNWLCPPPSPGKRVVRQPGIYLSDTSVHASHFRSGSPDSFIDDEDYDDVLISEAADQLRQGLPAPEENSDAASQRSKEVTGVYFLAGNPAPSRIPRKAAPLPDASQGTGYRKKTIVVLYILMGICFAMWAILLSLAVVKYTEISKELKSLNYTQSERLTNALRDLDAAQTERDRLEHNMNKKYKELRDFTASLCSALPESMKCAANWQRTGKACYYFSNMTRTWAGAKQFCIEQASHLVTVDTHIKQGFLINHNKNKRTYWLGLSDIAVEGTWRWEDNSPYTTSFWGSNEPDVDGDEEDCVTMEPNGLWKDSKCSKFNYWICETQMIC